MAEHSCRDCRYKDRPSTQEPCCDCYHTDDRPNFTTAIRRPARDAPPDMRDGFAKSALNGMLSHPTRYKPRPGAPADWHAAIAEEAYEIADAMLAARRKKNA